MRYVILFHFKVYFIWWCKLMLGLTDLEEKCIEKNLQVSVKYTFSAHENSLFLQWWQGWF
jgi:hypothetical protein